MLFPLTFLSTSYTGKAVFSAYLCKDCITPLFFLLSDRLGKEVSELTYLPERERDGVIGHNVGDKNAIATV